MNIRTSLPSGHVRTTKAQIRLRIRAVWSGPSLSANRVIRYCRICRYIANVFIGLCALAGWAGALLFSSVQNTPFIIGWLIYIVLHVDIVFLLTQLPVCLTVCLSVCVYVSLSRSLSLSLCLCCMCVRACVRACVLQLVLYHSVGKVQDILQVFRRHSAPLMFLWCFVFIIPPIKL